MTAADVAALLSDVQGDDPCGPALEYDPTFQAMERAAEGTPERQMGTTLVPAEDPDWKALHALAREVLGRSKDLRAAVLLTRAALRTAAVPGFAAGLSVIRSLLESRWEGLHPRLDPEDGNDPTFRMNILESLANLDATVRALRATPVVSSRALGRFALRDIEIAAGETPVPAGYPGTPPTREQIASAFVDADLDELVATADAVEAALADVDAIDAFLIAQLPAGAQADLGPLRACLAAMRKPLREALAGRGVSQNGADPDGTGTREDAGGGGGQDAPRGAISSLTDVEHALDRICEYYRTAQPASPLPLLLERARGMVRMDFMQLLEELAPGGTPEAEKILRSPKK